MGEEARRIVEYSAKMIGDALNLLSEVPLCDRCLGRMFALLGRGFSNKERGRAIKTLILMSLHERIRSGSEEAKTSLRLLAPRLGPIAGKLYSEVFGEEPTYEKCYVCGSQLGEVINKASREAVSKLRELDIRSFLVAARVDKDVKFREDELKRRFRLEYAESIGAEIRREVSKNIQAALNIKPDFDKPDAVLVVDFPSGSIEVQLMPVLFEGVYWKLARRVSQTAWVTRHGFRRYPFSVEDGLFVLADVMDATDVILHASGREDADARMLGTGRPFIVEVKAARRRSITLDEINTIVKNYAYPLVDYEILGEARRKDVRRVKGEEQRRAKLYKALVVVERDVGDDELKGIEEYFGMRSIRQRTPRRVRHRRPDVVRERLVFDVKTVRLGSRVFEAYIVAEGGLYIKELVSGDEGDTTPSFAEYLKAKAYCAELDVLAVYKF